MIAVSDAGPLNYLVLIDRIELLATLFDRIVVPSAVVRELSDEGASNLVRRWSASPPAWVSIQEPKASLPTVQRSAGELAAIALAKELGLPLLCDDLPARKIAARQGLAVSGTLGVLQQAHARGAGRYLDRPERPCRDELPRQG